MCIRFSSLDTFIVSIYCSGGCFDGLFEMFNCFYDEIIYLLAILEKQGINVLNESQCTL